MHSYFACKKVYALKSFQEGTYFSHTPEMRTGSHFFALLHLLFSPNEQWIITACQLQLRSTHPEMSPSVPSLKPPQHPSTPLKFKTVEGASPQATLFPRKKKGDWIKKSPPLLFLLSNLFFLLNFSIFFLGVFRRGEPIRCHRWLDLIRKGRGEEEMNFLSSPLCEMSNWGVRFPPSPRGPLQGVSNFQVTSGRNRRHIDGPIYVDTLYETSFALSLNGCLLRGFIPFFSLPLQTLLSQEENEEEKNEEEMTSAEGRRKGMLERNKKCLLLLFLISPSSFLILIGHGEEGRGARGERGLFWAPKEMMLEQEN